MNHSLNVYIYIYAFDNSGYILPLLSVLVMNYD